MFVDEFYLLVAEREVQGLGVFAGLGCVARTDQRSCDAGLAGRPVYRKLGKSGRVSFGYRADFIQQGVDSLYIYRRKQKILPAVIVLGKLVAWFYLAGQQASLQRRIGYHAHGIVDAPGDNVVVGLAKNHAEWWLRAGEGNHRLGPGHQLGREVARPGGTDFTLPHQLVQGAESFLDGRGIVRPMNLEHVYVVSSKSAQASLAFEDDTLRACVFADGDGAALQVVTMPSHLALFLAVPTQAELGHDDDLVASPGDGLGDEFLAMAKAVYRGGVDGGDARVKRRSDRGDGVVVVLLAPHPASDCPGAECYG